ncbi:MAG: phage shock protein PspA [Alphaproteobacteria bacterium]|nr:phage shock protein PspA [Alphaproteobacteria bacterium]
MGVFSRLSDIVNSNLSAMLDRAEDPEKMVRLAIQEMEDTLVEVRSQAARIIAERKGLVRENERLERGAAEWQRKAEFAVGKGRDDLARAALHEKTKLTEAVAALAEERAALDAALERGDEDVAKLEGKLAEAKAKQKTIRSRQESAGTRLRVKLQLHSSKVDEAMARLDRIEQRIDRTEGLSDAFDLGQRKTLSQELAELEADSAITAELEALKAKVGKTA